MQSRVICAICDTNSNFFLVEKCPRIQTWRMEKSLGMLLAGVGEQNARHVIGAFLGASGGALTSSQVYGGHCLRRTHRQPQLPRQSPTAAT